VALGEAELLAVSDLIFRKEALAYPGSALECELHPLDVNDVDPYPGYHETVHGDMVRQMRRSQKGL
jgi:hypothetical protein